MHLPSLPRIQQMLLAYCLGAERPTPESPANPTIQLQSCESSANHTPESYLESYHLLKLPGPTTVNKYTPILLMIQRFDEFFVSLIYQCYPFQNINIYSHESGSIDQNPRKSRSVHCPSRAKDPVAVREGDGRRALFTVVAEH